MLQIVPTASGPPEEILTEKEKPPIEPKIEPEASVSTSSTSTNIDETFNAEALIRQKAERRADKEKRRQAREQKRKEKERKRKEREKRRQMKLKLQTEAMIKVTKI